MQETIDGMVGFVQNNGGSVTWDELKTHVGPENWPRMASYVRRAEEQGSLKRVVSFSPETGVSFTVNFVGGA